jgi:hypothetical protein
MKIPESISNYYERLYDLCEEYPLKIPLDKAAEFLSIDKEGLRSAIEQGRCQFGLCVQKNQYANRAFTINTIAFYSWVTNGAIFQTLKISKDLESKPRKYKRSI